MQENLKDKSLSACAQTEMKKEIKQHEEDIELRNMQIDDLQQKIMDSDQGMWSVDLLFIVITFTDGIWHFCAFLMTPVTVNLTDS